MSDKQHKGHKIEKMPAKKRNPFFLGVVIGLVVLAGGLWFWYISLYGYISVDDSYIDRDKATVSSKILGKISKINAKEGNFVKKGDLLVELESGELNAQLNQATADLRATEQNINLQKLNLDKAQEDFGRSEAQYKSQIISDEVYSHAKKSLESAQIAYKMSISQVDVKKSQVEFIKTNLKNTTIYSPFNGIVAKKWVSEGDVVQPTQPIFSINNSEDLWATSNIEETHMKNVGIGDEVLIYVDAYNNKTFKGVIFDIGSSTVSQFSLIPPSNASGNFTKVTQRIPVKIQIKNLPGFDMNNLRPGMSIIVKFKKKR